MSALSSQGLDPANFPGHAIVQKLSLESGIDWDSNEFAARMDESDDLKEFRNQFHFPKTEHGEPAIYLCGNSLGLQPKNTVAYVTEELLKWQRFGVEGHFPGVNPERPWVTADEDCRDDMATIVGALPVEVAIMNSLTANLHFLLAAFYRPTATRYKILMEGKAFPSDKFALQSQGLFHGHEDAIIEMWPREGEKTLRTEDIEAKIAAEGESIACIVFSGIQYYTGQLFDMKRITDAGHAAGCKVGFDLAHAVGNAPLSLHEWGCDFACWCNYKYMNSGPGNIAGAFVHERWASDETLTRLCGWWGHRKSDRFEMEHKFIPSTGAQSFMVSNPPVLCIAALRASTDLFKQAGMERLRAKSERLTAYLEALVDTHLRGKVDIITPRDISARGAHLSLVFRLPVLDVHARVSAQGVICDVRKPDVMRIAPTPMYNSFADVRRFVLLLEKELS
jgi:kynureninase